MTISASVPFRNLRRLPWPASVSPVCLPFADSGKAKVWNSYTSYLVTPTPVLTDVGVVLFRASTAGPMTGRRSLARNPGRAEFIPRQTRLHHFRAHTQTKLFLCGGKGQDSVFSGDSCERVVGDEQIAVEVEIVTQFGQMPGRVSNGWLVFSIAPDRALIAEVHLFPDKRQVKVMAAWS